MSQTTLDGKPLTKIMRLRQIRELKYREFIQDIQSHIIFLRQRTETYKQDVKSLDKEIGIELRKQK